MDSQIAKLTSLATAETLLSKHKKYNVNDLLFVSQQVYDWLIDKDFIVKDKK